MQDSHYHKLLWFSSKGMYFAQITGFTGFFFLQSHVRLMNRCGNRHKQTESNQMATTTYPARASHRLFRVRYLPHRKPHDVSYPKVTTTLSHFEEAKRLSKKKTPKCSEPAKTAMVSLHMRITKFFWTYLAGTRRA